MTMAEAVTKLKDATITNNELDELSAQFFPLVRNIARKYGSKTDCDEYISAGNEGIAYALRTAAKKMIDDNLELWVKSCIYRYVQRCRVTSHLICIPNSTLRDAKQRGEVLATLKSHSILEHDDAIPKKGRLTEIQDCLEQCATDNLDKQIIKLRLEGYNDVEIGVMLDKVNTYIFKRRKRMEDKFNILLKGS